VREAGTALLGLIGTRVELLGLELREEALHLQRMLVLGVVAAFLMGGALVLFGILIAAAFWDTYRLLALGGVVVLYGAGGGLALMRLRSAVYNRAPPFDATVRELEADLKALREVTGDPTP